MSERDGGPAFPSVGEGFNDPLYSAPGMSLRDWFAGQALVGMGNEALSKQRAAYEAYEMADAMLAARASQAEGETQ